ncbi:MAG: hypothetical protein CMI90_02460 [Pelagibacteraceae bacterium]|nr:hypothetical protein [Pelagibacteraceae bacterium]|tara:strand:- start:2262 stop:2741 length:480 start_codon:yes stop_codon:yes gene_type:complete
MNKFIITFLIIIFSTLYVNAEEVTNTFGDWQYYCSDNLERPNCEIRQFAIDNSTNEIVSLISLNFNPENNTQLLVGLPHLINLKIPAIVNVDEKGKSEVAYTYCNENACFIAEVLTEEYLNLLKAGNIFSIESKLINNEKFKVNFSLKGFTEAIKNLNN